MHEIIAVHGKFFNGVDMLNAGDVGHIFDLTQFGCLAHGPDDVFIPGKIGSDKNHLAAHVPGEFFGFMPAFFVNIQSDGKQLVGRGRNRRGAADATGNAGDNADIGAIEIGVRKNQNLFP